MASSATHPPNRPHDADRARRRHRPADEQRRPRLRTRPARPVRLPAAALPARAHRRPPVLRQRPDQRQLLLGHPLPLHVGDRRRPGAGVVEGVAWLHRTSWRRFAVGFVAACALATSVAWGISPIGTQYRTGYWPLQATPGRRRSTLQWRRCPTTPPCRRPTTSSPTSRTAPDLHVPEPVDPPQLGRQRRGPRRPRPRPHARESTGSSSTGCRSAGVREAKLLATLLEHDEFEVVSDADGIVVARRFKPPVGEIGPDGLLVE